MFDKLRSKFILINMSLLTVVFISIFGTLYFMTNESMNREINASLNTLMIDNPNKDHRPKINSSNITVDLNSNGDIIQISTSPNIYIDTDIIKDYIDEVITSENMSSKINISNNPYIFLKRNYVNGIRIVFLDVSYQENFKISLLKIFISVGGVSLVILLLISIYLTNKSIKPIKDVFEKQKQFIADASHELKTPLTIIKTNTSLVLSNPDDTVKNQTKWINYINLQTDRISELVNEMLSLAKLDTKENTLLLSYIDISRIVETMLLQFDAIIYENSINLETYIEKDIFINGNMESMKKLFSIIMDNAIKHTKNKGTISVKLFLEKNTVKLSIKNTGEGIESEHINKIFERFYRIDSSRVRATGGYGLGLSIAKSIVEQHKGKIYAKSKVNEYTVFFVELPIKF
ncbi:sensor histidine kinase [Romboutsia sp. Marseille-P6047]|uniref:sensor histidine kinase n=1 Tax=Romboutsia sp. Marseille-P6047 TaxID=2161817 RepID=UPI000F048F40|nr:HAMP domain-containing sensor histidine kinase [Romboutsia sp. Marseille-P6047]